MRPQRRLARWFRRPGSRVLLVYCLLGLIADFPIFPGDPSKVPTTLGEDIVQTSWFLEWTPWAILHGHSLFSTNLIDYPKTVDLAQNTGIPLLGLLTAPLTLVANPIASMNLLRWVAFWLSAYAAFAVFRRWTEWTPAAFIGGLVYGFSPYMVAQGSVHLNLIFVPLPPVIFYLLGELFIFQRRRPGRLGLYLGLACAAQFYISTEVLATTAIVAAIAAFFLFFLCIREVPPRIIRSVIGLGIAAAVLLPLIGYPIWEAFHGIGHYAGPAQGYNNVYNADLLGPVVPSSNQLIVPTSIKAVGSHLVGNNLQENGSYLGIPLIVLLVTVVARYWRKLWTLYLALLAFTVFALSLGPVLIVDGKVKNLPFDLPFRKIDHLPGINNILPVRFSLYVVFFAAVLLARGIDAYRRDFIDRQILLGSARPPISVILGRIAGIGLVLASFIALVPNWPYPTRAATVNRAERPTSLSIIPTGSVVLTYPYPTSFSDQAMLWQALDSMRFRLLGSYALVAGQDGQSTVFPAVLQPSIVEAMLVNSFTRTPDSHLAPVVATQHTIDAARVIIEPPHAKRPHSLVAADTVGRVTSVDIKSRTFVIDISRVVPESVSVSSSTVFVDAGAARPSIAGVAPGKWVVVSGATTGGTVTPRLVSELRTFLRNNHVQAVVVDLGLQDAWEIGTWMRDALGKPTRAGGGGLIWIDVPARLRSSP